MDPLRAKTAHEEMVGEKNERQLASLTPETWHGLVVLRARAKFFDMDKPLEDLQHPTEGLIHEALQMSGAIGGEHRKDLRDTLIAASPTQASPLGIPILTAAQTPTTTKKKSGI